MAWGCPVGGLQVWRGAVRWEDFRFGVRLAGWEDFRFGVGLSG